MGVKFIGLEPCSSFSNEIPACPHGPMLLFERSDDGGGPGRRFYACAACRDRKQCAYFLWRDERLSQQKVCRWRARLAQALGPAGDHRSRYRSGQRAVAEGGALYCLDCSQLVRSADAPSHRSHEARPVDQHSSCPTQLLRPRSANKGQAQYLFSAETVDALLSVLEAAGVRRVLCCGAPRLHERLLRRDVPSLLLDCDRRFEEFWPPEQLCIYNMFNHHMFSPHGWDDYRTFIRANDGAGLCLLVDPPFGGKIEALTLTISSILADCRSADDSGTVPPPVFLVLPYFNEPAVVRSMPDVHMTDLRVEYDNHSKFTSDAGGRKYGSPVRLFTSLRADLVRLPEPHYRLCRPCGRWVHRDNVHCAQCGACTAKDGRPYRHCDLCRRCVKVTWQHCASCDRCTLPDHPCRREGRLLPTKRPAAGNQKQRKKRQR